MTRKCPKLIDDRCGSTVNCMADEGYCPKNQLQNRISPRCWSIKSTPIKKPSDYLKQIHECFYESMTIAERLEKIKKIDSEWVINKEELK